MRLDRILLITGNKGKLEEFKTVLGLSSLHFDYQSVDLPEIQSMDVRDIGRFKTLMALEKSIGLECFDAVLTDDTALSCDALNGLPGPLIKWFLETIGKDGIVDLLKDKSNSGSVTCLLSLGLTASGNVYQFEGTVRGSFVLPRGIHGFGWDPIFIPEGCSKSYGEMSPDEKNKISHRTLALTKLRDWLLSLN